MAEPQIERRKPRRRRVVKTGRILFGDYRYSFDCVIRDSTETGARLQIARTAEIPETFQLFHPDTRSLRSARIVWRRAGEVGVELSGSPVDIKDLSDPRFARFKFA